MLDWFKREWWKSQEYTTVEIKMMSEIHRCFRESKCGTNEPPELKMGTNKMPQHEISDQDLLPSVWNDKLQDGLLSTEVQDMISDITEYMSLRVESKIGNPNDPWNLTCYELLVWMSRDLSGAKCNDDTLIMVENRIQYLIKLGDAKIFKPEDEKTRRKMLSVITAIRTTLQHKIKPIINREIANSCVRDYLTELKKFGKCVLDYGFQFLYFSLRDTPKLTPADICLLPDELIQTRSGLLTKCLVDSSPYCTIFDTKDPSAMSRPNSDSRIDLEDEVTFINPFIDDNNQLCIPKSLIEKPKEPLGIYEYLSGIVRTSVKQTGILEAFRLENKTLTDFMEMHALLIELANTFMVCDQAYKSAGIGGDLLVYGQSNKLINNLMVTLKKLAEALTSCHNRIKMAISAQEAKDSGNTVASLPKGTKAWFKNIRNLPSINTHLEKTLSLCTEQANKIQTSSNKISAEERLEIAKKQTMHFTETAELVSSHVNNFLTRQPMSEPSLNFSPRSPSAKLLLSPNATTRSPIESANSDKQQIPGSRGRSTTFTMGVKPSSNGNLEQNASSALAPPSTQFKSSHKLDLRGSQARFFTDNLINIIIQLIRAKNSLEKVQLKNNQLTSNRTTQLWKALAECSSLYKLNFTNNPKLFDVSQFLETQIESVNAFSDFIKSTKTLRMLHINSCGINFQSAAFIASCLSVNHSIEVLDLGGNPLGDEGIEAVCVALQNNKKIYDLRLNYIEITNNGATHILELLKSCTQITDLMLDDESISKEMKEKIGLQLFTNRQLLLDQQNPFKNQSNTHSDSSFK